MDLMSCTFSVVFFVITPRLVVIKLNTYVFGSFIKLTFETLFMLIVHSLYYAFGVLCLLLTVLDPFPTLVLSVVGTLCFSILLHCSVLQHHCMLLLCRHCRYDIVALCKPFLLVFC